MDGSLQLVLGLAVTLIGRIQETSLPTLPPVASGNIPAAPIRIAVAPDHSVWITKRTSGKVINVTRDGRISVITSPTDAVPDILLPLPDGRVLFTQHKVGQTEALGRGLLRLGCAARDRTCTGPSFAAPLTGVETVAKNRFGEFGATDWHARYVGRLTRGGQTSYRLPAGFIVIDIAAADDGAFWFGLSPELNVPGPSRLGRITRDGVLSLQSLPAGDHLTGLTAWKNGVAYVAATGDHSSVVVFITPGSTGARKPVSKRPAAFVTSSHDDVWYVPQDSTGTLGHVDPQGTEQSYAPRLLRGDVIVDIAVDSDTLWCITVSNKLFRIQLTRRSDARQPDPNHPNPKADGHAKSIPRKRP